MGQKQISRWSLRKGKQKKQKNNTNYARSSLFHSSGDPNYTITYRKSGRSTGRKMKMVSLIKELISGVHFGKKYGGRKFLR